MKVSARLSNSENINRIELQTNDSIHSIQIPSKPTGFGSKANGAELLFLALATCYCNDIYREAARRNIKVNSVQVEVEGEFGAEGEPAKNISYKARVNANAEETQIKDLMSYTDKVAEIQNTLRRGIPVNLKGI